MQRQRKDDQHGLVHGQHGETDQADGRGTALLAEAHVARLMISDAEVAHNAKLQQYIWQCNRSLPGKANSELMITMSVSYKLVQTVVTFGPRRWRWGWGGAVCTPYGKDDSRDRFYPRHNAGCGRLEVLSSCTAC